jgi:hypothetical protein
MSSMLTFAQRRSLIFESLSDAHQQTAAGRFSGPTVLHGDDAARITSYFDRGQPANVRKINLLASKAILYADQGTFRIMSSPMLTLDTFGQEIFIGHDGDSIFYPSPVSIPAKDATDNVKVLVYDSADPDEPSALHDLVADRPITDTIPIHDDAGNAIGEQNVSFPFPTMDPDNDYMDYRIGALPAALPLPSGHGLDPVGFTNLAGLEAFYDKLKNICPHASEWAVAFVNAYKWYGGATLDVASLETPDVFTSSLPTNNSYRSSIFLSTSPVSVTSNGGKDLIRRIVTAKNDNIDQWFHDNPAIFEEYAARFERSAPTATPTTPTPTLTTYESRSDKTAAANVSRARAIMALFLCRPGTNSNGTPILVPGQVSPTFEDALNNSPSRSFRLFERQYRALVDSKNAEDSLNMIHNFMTKFPYIMVNQIFAACLTNGHWAISTIQEEANTVGQNLSVLTFAPIRTGTAEYKRQQEETNAILGEDLVGTANSQRTKGSLQLYNGGSVLFHGHLLNMLANFILVLEAADAPGQATEALLLTHLKEFFRILASKEVTQWIQHFTREATGEHLAYAIALEMHNNALMHFNRFATSADRIQDVLTGTDILATELSFYDGLRAVVINNWQTNAASASLGIYLSPPSTWVSSKANKEPPKKSPKTTDTSSPGGKPPKTNTPSPTPTGTGGSNPDYGMLLVPDNIRHGPQMSSGKRLCLLFSAKGKSCTKGYQCTNHHATLKNISLPDLQTIDKWVNDNSAVNWNGRRPSKLGDADAQPTPGTPPAAMPVAQVSPVGNNPTHG